MRRGRTMPREMLVLQRRKIVARPGSSVHEAIFNCLLTQIARSVPKESETSFECVCSTYIHFPSFGLRPDVCSGEA
eukprot:5162089-Amphidinium_carterae.1